MKTRKISFLILSLFCLSTAAIAAEPSIGLVNFPKCVTESKFGKQEQEAFEQVKSQMTTLISDLEKQRQQLFNCADLIFFGKFRNKNWEKINMTDNRDI